MDKGKEKEITEEYQKFWNAAEELAKRDVELYPLVKKEPLRDRVERHLLVMMEMYSIRYGDPEIRLRIVEFLEKQLFKVPPLEGEICHLTLDMWRDLRHTIISGEYREMAKVRVKE